MSRHLFLRDGQEDCLTSAGQLSTAKSQIQNSFASRESKVALHSPLYFFPPLVMN